MQCGRKIYGSSVKQFAELCQNLPGEAGGVIRDKVLQRTSVAHDPE